MTFPTVNAAYFWARIGTNQEQRHDRRFYVALETWRLRVERETAWLNHDWHRVDQIDQIFSSLRSL